MTYDVLKEVLFSLLELTIMKVLDYFKKPTKKNEVHNTDLTEASYILILHFFCCNYNKNFQLNKKKGTNGKYSYKISG